MPLFTSRAIKRAPPCRRGGASAPAAAPSFDAWASSSAALWCPGASLLTAYAGSLFRVRRADNNAEADIGFVAGTRYADIAALNTHCTGPATDGFLVSVYDQSGNARTVTNATAAQQHKIYDSATGAVLVNGRLCALGAGSDDNMARSDSSGVSGTAAKSVAWCGKPSAVASGNLSILGTVVSPGVGVILYVGATSTVVGSQLGNNSYREYTSTDYTAAMQRLVLRIAASGTQGTTRVRQNGVTLAELSSLNPSVASNTNATGTNALGRSSGAANGTHCAAAVWTADISDTDADLWNTVMQTMYG